MAGEAISPNITHGRYYLVDGGAQDRQCPNKGFIFKGWLYVFVYMDVAGLVSSCFKHNKKVGMSRF